MQTQRDRRDKTKTCSFQSSSCYTLRLIKAYIVAVKKFKESDQDENIRKTSIREVKILRMMRHENIVELKEAFRRKEKLYLVFEYMDHTLLEIIEKYPKGIPVSSIF